MEMLKDALCLELRNLLNVWTAANENPSIGPRYRETIRRKVYKACDALDRCERLEKFMAVVP